MIWMQWWSVVAPLRAACSRERSFMWLVVALAGFCVRGDLLGVSSTVRSLGLAPRCHDRLLDFFHSPAVDIERLTQLWARQVLKLFPIYRFAGRPVLLGDGIKIPKSGRKMPAVKKLHQESDNNTKPEYIMGHSVQVISMLVGAGTSFFAVPPGGRIHEGVKFTNRDKRALPGKFGDLIESLDLGEPFTLVAEALLRLRAHGDAPAETWLPSPLARALYCGSFPSAAKLPRNSGTQYVHHKSAGYRNAVRRKIAAYDRHIQIGLIAQGILQYLAVTCPSLVWASFGSWLRTIRPGIPPSEFVTSTALAHALPQFLADRNSASSFKIFLRENLDVSSYEAIRLTG